MRLLHIADIHLDRPFVGMALEDARARRRELRSTFERCLQLAADQHVDLVTLGGDLWEDEHVTPDTLRWVRDRLGALSIPVVAVAGNHDPLSPGGPYERASFSSAVTVLPSDQGLVEYQVGDISIWGASWRKGISLSPACLREFKTPTDGRNHVLLIHGTCGVYFEGQPHCPFTVDEVKGAGFDMCLAGHLHAGSVKDDVVVYPGSPEPLSWQETGRHCVAAVGLGVGERTIDLIDVATRRYVAIDVDCDGADSSAEIQRRVAASLDAYADMGGLCFRVRLIGRVESGCLRDVAVVREEILALGATMADVIDETAVAFDLDEIADGTGVSAVFVKRMRDIQAKRPGDPAVDLAIQYGLRALQGEEL